MKKFLVLFFACVACSTMQSCLEYDEPGDELGLGQVLNPDTNVKDGGDSSEEGQGDDATSDKNNAAE